MTDSESELREEVKAVVRKHDPTASDVSELIDGLEDYRDRLEALDNTL